uniref:F-box domain-containing protein n=1 Tax=Gossypium raimondii TaxID=29730 RepID=A0A0D2M9L4_GOSRA|nr:hypothetical protein B456_002G114500 [Gossypium raimondii]
MFSESVSEEALRQDFETLTVSKRLVRSVSQKLRKKNHRGEGGEEDKVRGVSLKCLTLYGRGGGCKVGADTGEELGDPSYRRRSSASEEGKVYKSICGIEDNNFDCFSYGVREKFWKKNNRKDLDLEESVRNSRMHIFLPDDILEMCLVRLPLTSLMNARLVCKKWRHLTTTPRFLQMRREGSCQKPWLFLFGAVKDGYCSGEIHALDMSQDQWHRISADILRGRFMFSVASMQDDIYIVGGLGSWDEPLNSGEIYDSLSNKWTEIQKLPIDFGVVCAGVVCNGMFYVCSENDKLAGYDIERGFWIGIQTSAFPPHVHEYYPKLVSCNGSLFLLSVSWCEGDGQIGRRNKAVRKLWELDLMYLTWTEVSVHPDAPMDWNPVFVADRNLIFGVEMFKIFGQVLDFFTVCDVSDVEMNWSHISRNHMAHELDASSCMTKTMAVLHL